MKRLILSIITFFAVTFFCTAQIIETKNKQLGAQNSSIYSYYSVTIGTNISSSNVSENSDSINFSYAATSLNPMDETEGLAHKLISISARSSEQLASNTSGGIDTYFATSTVNYLTATETAINNIEKSSDKKIIIAAGNTYEFVTEGIKGIIQITSIDGDINNFTSYLSFNIKYVIQPKIDCNGDLDGTAYIDGCNICVGGNTEIVSTCEVVNIPDEGFLSQLISVGVDKNDDGEIQVQEAELVTDLTGLSWDILDFTGLEKFINLEKISCGGSGTVIFEHPNIDFSKNVKLTHIYCGSRKMTSLNLENNINLIDLSCTNSSLTTLDVSNNPHLKKLDCRYSDSLTTVCVYSTNEAENNIEFLKDTETSWSEECGKGNATVQIEDVNFSSTLISLGLDKNNDGEIQYSEVSSVKTLTLSNQNISDLTGIENFINLDSLIADNNLLKNLDITILDDLVYLNVDDNLLEVLTTNSDLLFQNNQRIQNVDTKLTYLSCANNELKELDVSQYSNLTYLNCSQNSTLPVIYVSSVDKAINQFTKDNDAEWKERTINGTLTTNNSENITIVKAYNLQGKEVSIHTKNELIIILYDNGTTKKVFQK